MPGQLIWRFVAAKLLTYERFSSDIGLVDVLCVSVTIELKMGWQGCKKSVIF